jgi:hypothetical protein
VNDPVAERTRRYSPEGRAFTTEGFRPHWSADTAARGEARYAPEGYVFTMTMFIVDVTAAVIFSRVASFGMTIDSPEDAEL